MPIPAPHLGNPGFSVGIGYNLARGHKPECRCFGRLSSAPIGIHTLFRNAILAAAVGPVIWAGPGESVLEWVERPTHTQLLLAAVLLLASMSLAEGWFLSHLLRQHGRILLRLDDLEARMAVGGIMPGRVNRSAGPPVGAPAPDFELAALDGDRVMLESLRAVGRPIVLVFSEPNYGACVSLRPEVAAWQQAHADRLTIAVISTGTPEANRPEVAESTPSSVLLQNRDEVAGRYQVAGVPSAIMILPDGTIGSPLAEGVTAVRGLITRGVAGPASALAGHDVPGNGQAKAPALHRRAKRG